MEEMFKEYAKKVCINCVNPECEIGKGIVICAYKDIICARCVDYMPDKEKIKESGYKDKLITAKQEKFHR